MAGNLRSPRKRALEIGTDSSKFEDAGDYDTNAGVPTSHPGHGGTYDQSASDGGKATGGAGPVPGPKPFR